MITFKLDKAYQVDAIFVMGLNEIGLMLSEFYLYVGYDADFRNNQPCPDGPYAYPLDDNYDTYEFGSP